MCKVYLQDNTLLYTRRQTFRYYLYLVYLQANTLLSTSGYIKKRLSNHAVDSLLSIKLYYLKSLRLSVAARATGAAGRLLCYFSRSSLLSGSLFYRSLGGSIRSLGSLLAATFLSLLAAFGLLAFFAALTLFALSRFLAATHSANGYKRDKQNFFHNTKN